MLTRLGGLLAVAIVALGMAAPQAHAVVIYDFTGVCDLRCTGQATAVLTLADTYVPGTQVTDADFVSFSYNSDSGSYNVPPDAGLELIFGPAVLPAVSGQATISFDFTDAGRLFQTSAGSWSSVFASLGIDHGGTEYEWVLRELPAPGPLSLLALGLAGLMLAGRRRNKAVA